MGSRVYEEINRSMRSIWILVAFAIAIAFGCTLYGIYFIMNCDGVVVRGLLYPPLVCIEVKKIKDRVPQ